jgi:hypothetical protein
MKILLVAMIMILSGCMKSDQLPILDEKINRTITNAFHSVAMLKAAEAMFPKNTKEIYYFYRPKNKQPRLEFVAYIGERYILLLRSTIKIDYDSETIQEPKEFEVYLDEVIAVNESNRGTLTLEHGQHWKIENKDFVKILEANGDFTVIGISLNPKPVEKFTQLYENAKDSQHGNE